MNNETYYAFIVFIFIRTITSYAYFIHYYPSNFPTKHGPIYGYEKSPTNDAGGQLDFLKYSRSGDRNDPLNWKAKLESTWRAPPRSFVLPPDDLFLPKKRTQRRTWTASCTYTHTHVR